MVEKRVEQQLRTSQMEDDVVNVEFLEWLKLWGPRIFIACCLAVIIFRLGVMWFQYQEDRKSEAWRDLANTESVAGLLAVADDHGSTGSIAELAWLRAAADHYQTILANEPQEEGGDALNDALSDSENKSGNDDPATTDELTNETDQATDGADESGDDGTADDSTSSEDESAQTKEEPKRTRMSEEERTDLLNKMSDLYQRVLDAAKDNPDKQIFEIRAMFGMASVAEMKLDYADAKSWYQKAEDLCGDRFTKLKLVAQKRIEDMNQWVEPIEFPTNDEVKAIEEQNKVPDLLKRPEGESDQNAEQGTDQKPVGEAESGDDAPGQPQEQSQDTDDGSGGDGGG